MLQKKSLMLVLCWKICIFQYCRYISSSSCIFSGRPCSY